MPELVPAAPGSWTLDRAAHELARDIKGRRNGLRQEEINANGAHPTYARAKKYREQDQARVHGMVIALTYMLGYPLAMDKAEEFIAEHGHA